MATGRDQLRFPGKNRCLANANAQAENIYIVIFMFAKYYPIILTIIQATPTSWQLEGSDRAGTRISDVGSEGGSCQVTKMICDIKVNGSQIATHYLPRNREGLGVSRWLQVSPLALRPRALALPALSPTTHYSCRRYHTAIRIHPTTYIYTPLVPYFCRTANVSARDFKR